MNVALGACVSVGVRVAVPGGVGVLASVGVRIASGLEVRLGMVLGSRPSLVAASVAVAIGAFTTWVTRSSRACTSVGRGYSSRIVSRMMFRLIGGSARLSAS